MHGHRLSSTMSNNIVTMIGSVYLVLFNHISASTFDPNANNGAGHNFYGLLLSNPTNVLPSAGLQGQYLVKISDSDYDIGWQTPVVFPTQKLLEAPGPDLHSDQFQCRQLCALCQQFGLCYHNTKRWDAEFSALYRDVVSAVHGCERRAYTRHWRGLQWDFWTTVEDCTQWRGDHGEEDRCQQLGYFRASVDMSLVDGGGDGDSGSTRKTHIKRIYKNDDPDTGLWIDIEQIDELTYTSGVGFAQQEKVWKFDWSSFDPDGDGVSKKKIQAPNNNSDPDDPDAAVIEVPIREKLVVTQGAKEQYQQYNHFFANNNTNISRETHSRRVYHYDVPDDQLDENKNPPRDPQDYLNALGAKDNSQYLEVEILDKFWTNEKESRNSHGRLKPSTWQEKRWLVATASDALLHDRDGDTSKDFATNNPADGVIDPPWRLDPLQNIVNINLANITFIGGLNIKHINYVKTGKTKKQNWKVNPLLPGEQGNFNGSTYAKITSDGGERRGHKNHTSVPTRRHNSICRIL